MDGDGDGVLTTGSSGISTSSVIIASSGIIFSGAGPGPGPGPGPSPGPGPGPGPDPVLELILSTPRIPRGHLYAER